MSGTKYHPEIEFINSQQLAEDILKDKIVVGKDIVLVDVRDNDFVGGNVTGAINAPSKKFEEIKEDLLSKAKQAPRVIFYCGSSVGRGPRVAGWYKDMINSKVNEKGNETLKQQKVEVLTNGFKAWWPLYKDETKLVENFDSNLWEKENK